MKNSQIADCFEAYELVNFALPIDWIFFSSAIGRVNLECEIPHIFLLVTFI